MRLSWSALLLAALSSTAAAVFVPPAAFKNVNLVHVVSLEKNYAKETINVVIENIDDKPQQEYYVPFTADQIARVGGFTVKDRKDSTIGAFAVDTVEDSTSDIQYYRIHLPAALAPGSQQTIGITYFVLSAYRPLPAAIAQDDKQYLVYKLSAHVPSAYATLKQKTEVKFPSGDVPDYTTVVDKAGESATTKLGSKITYGPFEEQAATAPGSEAAQPVEVRFEFTKPVTHVAVLERDIEVSHWGGNVAFEERYTLLNRGANLSTLFNRVKWAQSQYYNPSTSALREIRFPLRVGSADAYFTDVIGNVSTSRFRTNRREALLEVKPRYPVFGGWKFPFTIGWNADAKHLLRRLSASSGGSSSSSGSYVLNVPFLEGPRQPEGVEYASVRVQILLPEGAENVKHYTTIPASSIVSATVTRRKTYLDTVGRTALTIEARNLVDDLRDSELLVTYDYSLLASLRKPLVIFSSMVGLFGAAWLIGRVELKFSTK